MEKVVCKYCGLEHSEDVHVPKRRRPAVTQRAADIIERRPPAYKVLTYDLSKPRINELQNFLADTIFVIETIPADLQFTIRINHHENDEIPMRLGRSVSIPFVRFLLTTPKYSGGKLKLMIGGELGEFKFESPDIIQEEVTDDKILATRRRDIIYGYAEEPSAGTAGTFPAWFVTVTGEESFLLEKIQLRTFEDFRTVEELIIVDKISYGWGRLGGGGNIWPEKSIPFYSLHYNRREPDFLLNYSRHPRIPPFEPPSHMQSEFLNSKAELQIDFSVPVIIEKGMGWTFGLHCAPPPGWAVGFRVTFWGYKIPGSGIRLAPPPEPPPAEPAPG